MTAGAGFPLAQDFIQYWGAFRIVLDGGNPYDAQVMQSLQLSMGRSPENIAMFWNPPWALIILAPFLFFSYQTSAIVWVLVNCCLAVGTIAIARQIYLPKSALSRSALLVSALFFPLYENIFWGQISLLLAFIISSWLWAMHTKRYVLAGVLFSLLSIKPHLFHLLGVLFFFWSDRKNAMRFFLAAVASVVALVFASYMLSPVACSHWVSGIDGTRNAGGVVSVYQWFTATFPAYLRYLLWNGQGTPPTWPMWFVPMSSWLLLGAYLFIRKQPIDWKRDAAWVLGLSLFTSPYGWYYDQSTLLFAWVALSGLVFNAPLRNIFRDPNWRVSTKFWAPIVMIVTLLALWGMSIREGGAQHYYVWLPPLISILWLSVYTHRNSKFRFLWKQIGVIFGSCD